MIGSFRNEIKTKLDSQLGPMSSFTINTKTTSHRYNLNTINLITHQKSIIKNEFIPINKCNEKNYILKRLDSKSSVKILTHHIKHLSSSNELFIGKH